MAGVTVTEKTIKEPRYVFETEWYD